MIKSLSLEKHKKHVLYEKLKEDMCIKIHDYFIIVFFFNITIK